MIIYDTYFRLLHIKLLDPFEHWEEATFILRHSGFQVKINKTETIQISAKFSENLSVCLTNVFPPSSLQKIGKRKE